MLSAQVQRLLATGARRVISGHKRMVHVKERLVQWLRRRWLLVAVIIATVILVILQFEEIVIVLVTLVRGQWQWVLLAILLQIAFYILYAALYQAGFATVDVDSRVAELIPVLFASIFVKTIVPSGGVSSLAVFVDDAARRGQSPIRAAQGALLVLIADLAAITPLILVGLAYLSSQGVLENYQTVASAIFLAIVAALAGILILGRWLPKSLHALISWVQEQVNWLASLVDQRPLLPPDWADQMTRDYIIAANDIVERPRGVARTGALALAGDLINLISLYALTLAYRQPLPFGAVTAVFSMNIVFSVVTIIPNGIGVAEGVTVLVLTTLGVPLPDAVAITIAFRGLNVWLPLGIGFLFLRQVRSFGGRGK